MDQRIDSLESMLTKTSELIRSISDKDHQLGTPCSDYTVAQLLEHVAVWVQVFDTVVNGTELSFDPREHTIESGWADLVDTAGASIISGLRSQGTDREMEMMGNPMPGEFILNMMLMEYVGHSWDLARATGRDLVHSEVEATAALLAAQTIVQPEHRGAMFGQPLDPENGATAMEQYVCFIGRDPHWSASSSG